MHAHVVTRVVVRSGPRGASSEIPAVGDVVVVEPVAVGGTGEEIFARHRQRRCGVGVEDRDVERLAARQRVELLLKNCHRVDVVRRHACEL